MAGFEKDTFLSMVEDTEDTGKYNALQGQSKNDLSTICISMNLLALLSVHYLRRARGLVRLSTTTKRSELMYSFAFLAPRLRGTLARRT